MYRRTDDSYRFTKRIVSFSVQENSYKPFSYYVLGGLDVDGSALSMDASVEADDDSFLSSAINNLEDPIASPYDPRTSVFDMVEVTGVSAYEDYKTALAAEGSSETTPSDSE